MPSDKTVEELEDIKCQLYDEVWPLISDFENKQWKLNAGTDKAETGLVYEGHHDKIGAVWKIELLLNISANEFEHAFVMNDDYDWLPKVKEFKQLERCFPVGKKWGYGFNYSRSSGRGSLADDRDFINLDFYERTKENWRLVLTTGGSHSDDPKPKDSCIRGEPLPSAMIIRPVPGEPYRCEVIWMYNLDMKGFLPRALVNLAMPSFFLDLGKALVAKCKQMAAKRKN